MIRHRKNKGKIMSKRATQQNVFNRKCSENQFAEIGI